MLNFAFFLEKVLGPNFVDGSSRKMFLTLYSVNWLNFIAQLSLLLEILVNMFLAILCYLIFLIKPFFNMIVNSRQRTRRLLGWNKKHLSAFLKIFHSSQKYVSDLGVHIWIWTQTYFCFRHGYVINIAISDYYGTIRNVLSTNTRFTVW